jgi:hypothetical protein
MSKSDLIDLAVEIRHETARAFLVHDGHRDVWIPKSQCEVTETSGPSVITLPEWLAKDKGLI